MAFGDPQSVTITGYNSGAAISLPRTEDQQYRSAYTSSDGLYRLEISHMPSGRVGATNYRVKSMAKLTVTVIATDPFNADRNISQTASVWVVVDRPSYGFSQTNLVNIAAALFTLLTASSNAALVKLTGNEH